jgi:Tol biopolymer transport system component
VAWTPEGRSLIYADIVKGRQNLFRWPLDAVSPTQLTALTAEDIINFALSRDGTRLAFSRGTFTSDVVLITRNR